MLALGEIALAYSRVLLIDINGSTRFLDVSLPLLTVPTFIAALYWLVFRYRSANVPHLAALLSWSALGPLLGLIATQAAPENIALYGAAAFLAMLIYGVYRNDRDIRLQSYLVAALTLLPTLFLDLSPARPLISLSVVGIFYASRFIVRRDQPEVRASLGIAASAVLAAVLFNWISGGMLTVAWGIEGLALLIAGFPLRDRIFRIQGLTLLLICTLKLFLYDLRNLETPYRILSFIVLGLMLLSVSWIYSRFREQVRKML